MKIAMNFILLLVFCGIGEISAQDWKVYESEHGKFSILTPALMKQKRATISTGIASLDVHTHFLNTTDSSGNFLYLINYYDLPDEMFPEDSTDFAMEFLLNTMDQSVSDVGGDLQYSNPIDIGKHPGLMWRSKSEDNVVKSRAYIINNRFYMLQVFSVPNKSLNADIDRFLDSFTLRT
jgi:hypothetical protein